MSFCIFGGMRYLSAVGKLVLEGHIPIVSDLISGFGGISQNLLILKSRIILGETVESPKFLARSSVPTETKLGKSSIICTKNVESLVDTTVLSFPSALALSLSPSFITCSNSLGGKEEFSAAMFLKPLFILKPIFYDSNS
ncbi:unnamed protein product [Meganyctiphanes norvegica]|uniref:Uncharacterized protein n=1 Tax=Meganyctiphanes norvegica TaxID=48144 RepID=A0AAV2SSF4_MEGNR